MKKSRNNNDLLPLAALTTFRKGLSQTSELQKRLSVKRQTRNQNVNPIRAQHLYYQNLDSKIAQTMYLNKNQGGLKILSFRGNPKNSIENVKIDKSHQIVDNAKTMYTGDSTDMIHGSSDPYADDSKQSLTLCNFNAFKRNQTDLEAKVLFSSESMRKNKIPLK